MNRQSYRTGQKAFTRKEFEKLISKVGVLEDAIFLLLGGNTGLRRKDMASIEIANIDLKNKSLTYYEHKKRRTRTTFEDGFTIELQNLGIKEIW